ILLPDDWEDEVHDIAGMVDEAGGFISGITSGADDLVVVNANARRSADDVAPDGWAQRGADNNRGTVWQAPDADGNANMVRVMDPTEQYPNGYVRFHNEHGQPIDLNGRPGAPADTHIPIDPDNTFPTPEGWPS
ncbi:MAG: hypothetical protein AAF485_23620, partial [Chloroflexota bacterium]